MCASVSVCVSASPQAKPSLNLGGVAGHLKATLVWQKHVGDNQDRLTVLCHKKNIQVVHQKKYLNSLSLSQTHFVRILMRTQLWLPIGRMVPQHPVVFTPCSFDYQIIYYVWENGDHPLLGTILCFITQDPCLGKYSCESIRNCRDGNPLSWGLTWAQQPYCWLWYAQQWTYWPVWDVLYHSSMAI